MSLPKSKMFDGVPVTVRLHNCLLNYGFNYWWEVAKIKPSSLKQIYNLGKVSRREITEVLRDMDLTPKETFIDIYGS